MSVKLMGQVWELDLPHNAQSILLALADHADDDGYCYPSVGRLAWKTGYGVRQVQRTLKDLRDQKLAIPTGSVVGGRHNTTVYKLHPSAGKQKPPFQPKTERQTLVDTKGANLTPFDGDSEIKGDIQDVQRVTFETERVSPESQKGDIAMSPKPSGTVKDSSIEPSRAQTANSHEHPEWYEVLSEIRQFKNSYPKAEAWRTRQNIPLEMAIVYAYELKAFMLKTKNTDRDAWATFQAWLRRDRDSWQGQLKSRSRFNIGNNRGAATQSANSPDWVAIAATHEAREPEKQEVNQ